MAEIVITVHGTPAPQGSKRAFAGKDGKVHVIESSHDRVKSWRQAVLEEAIEACSYLAAPTTDGGLNRGPLDGPLAVEMTFYLRRPKGHYGSGKNATVLKPSAPRRPARMPDLSKLIRSTEDALSDAGLWADDALVVDITAAKHWDDARPPGAHITIREVEQEP